METRSWRWLQVRILGLLDRPVSHEAWTGLPVFTSRLQAHFFTPATKESVDASR